MKKKVICIAGPTASGKTALGVTLAENLGGEVVSADSMQIYKGMDIASAVPGEEEMRGIPHHLIRFVDPSESYSVADYCRDADRAVKEILERGKVPIMVGGTGLYISSFTNNISFVPEKTEEGLREEIEREYNAVGGEAMLKKLAEIDPQTAERLHPNDAKRIIRAFEVYRLTGATVTQQNINSVRESPYDFLIIGLFVRERQYLYDRINRRTDEMIKSGLAEEARRFPANDAPTAKQAIGHKELRPYLEGECTLDEAAENLKMQTRRYAKRQITWFKRMAGIVPLYIDDYSSEELAREALKICGTFLKGE